MQLMASVREIYRTSAYKNMGPSAQKFDRSLKLIATILLSVISLVMTLMNIYKGYWIMAVSTGILVLGFSVSFFIFLKNRSRAAGILIISLLIAALFTLYAVTGQNEGFAILWILLVPPIALNVLGLSAGTAISIYFLLLLVSLFYTPVRSCMSAFYTQTFMSRFPVLYVGAAVISLLLSWQRQFFSHKTETMLFTDALTDVGNRMRYRAEIEDIETANALQGLTLISSDINFLKDINDSFGHEAGDRLIIDAAVCLKTAFPDARAICRTGGDEFMVITYTDPGTLSQQLDVLKSICCKTHTKYYAEVSMATGHASQAEYPDASIPELEKTADNLMYIAKEACHKAVGKPIR